MKIYYPNLKAESLLVAMEFILCDWKAVISKFGNFAVLCLPNVSEMNHEIHICLLDVFGREFALFLPLNDFRLQLFAAVIF